MSVEYRPHLMVGWMVEDDDDERLNDLCDDDFEELEAVSERIGEKLGINGVWGDSLVIHRNRICCDEGWVVGVPLAFGEPVSLEFADVYAMMAIANEVWLAVYDTMPPSPPSLIAFMEVY